MGSVAYLRSIKKRLRSLHLSVENVMKTNASINYEEKEVLNQDIQRIFQNENSQYNISKAMDKAPKEEVKMRQKRSTSQKNSTRKITNKIKGSSHDTSGNTENIHIESKKKVIIPRYKFPELTHPFTCVKDINDAYNRIGKCNRSSS